MENFVKISKADARKKFAEGKTIYLTASKIRLGNMWVQPVAVDNSESREFEKVLDAFRYYNCNTECGLGVRYYLKSEN